MRDDHQDREYRATKHHASSRTSYTFFGVVLSAIQRVQQIHGDSSCRPLHSMGSCACPPVRNGVPEGSISPLYVINRRHRPYKRNGPTLYVAETFLMEFDPK